MFIIHFVRKNSLRDKLLTSFVKILFASLIKIQPKGLHVQCITNHSAKLFIHAEHGYSAQLSLLTKRLVQSTFTFVTSVLEVLHEAQT